MKPVCFSREDKRTSQIGGVKGIGKSKRARGRRCIQEKLNMTRDETVRRKKARPNDLRENQAIGTSLRGVDFFRSVPETCFSQERSELI